MVGFCSERESSLGGESREKNVMTHPVQRSVWDVKPSRFATLPVVPRLTLNSHFLTDKAREAVG